MATQWPELPDADQVRGGTHRALVIGVGNPFRRDDGIGEAVVRRLAMRLRDRPRGSVRVIVLDGEPARMVEAWDGADLAVVVDAARSAAAPGEVHQVELFPGNPDRDVTDGHGESDARHTGAVGTSDDATRAGDGELGVFRTSVLASSHGAGVADAVALGSALGRLPRRLVLWTVTGGDFGDGPGLSPSVEAAVDQVVEQAADLLRELAEVRR